MIVFISAQQPQIEGPIDSRFGRSAWLIKVETTSGQWQAFPNPGQSQSGGAGVAAAQFVIDQKADTVVSGDFGPNAFNALQAANITMVRFTDEVSTCEQALVQFTQGKLPVFNK